MSTSIIPELQSKKDYYIGKRDEARNKISSCERAYESIRGFKSSVMHSQEDFDLIRGNKAGSLYGIEEIEPNCITARKYCDGMREECLGIWAQGIEKIYSALIGAATKKLNSYSDLIQGYEDDIAYYERKIADIEREIAAEEAAMEAIEAIEAIEAVVGGKA